MGFAVLNPSYAVLLSLLFVVRLRRLRPHLRRRQALKTFEEFLFGHAIGRDFHIVGLHISRDGATWQAIARCTRFPSLYSVAAALAPFRRSEYARGCARGHIERD